MWICFLGPSPSLLKNVSLLSTSFNLINCGIVIDIFVNMLKNTDDVGQLELTQQEEEEVEQIMKNPKLKRYLDKDADLN